MKRLHKILLGIFCIGVLLCGLGTGITAMEFSGLDYIGEKVIGECEMKQETIDISLQEKTDPTEVCCYYNRDIVFDESVPEDVVRFRLSYNSKRVKPIISEEEDRIELYWNWFMVNETEAVMEVKDEILENLKNGKIGSYGFKGIEKIEIMLHPSTEKKVHIQ